MISLIIGFACWIGCADIVVDVISALFNNEESPVPRSRSTGRFRQENTGNQWNMETVFQPDRLCIFSIDFWLASRSFRQETPVNHRKKSENFPVGILLPFLIIFWTFSKGSSDFSASFRLVPVKFQLFSVAEIIVLCSSNSSIVRLGKST